jgi:hypothetical protein
MRMTGTREQDMEKARQEGYAEWIRKKVLSDHECETSIRKAGLKPSKQASCYEVYDINGFRFHTETYGQNKATKSSGVCIKGECDEIGVQHDYYGVLQEIIELSYDGGNKVALFRCIWFDITSGVRKDSKHGIVEVKHSSRLKGFEPFVLACQAIQVVYIPYASDTVARRPWWVAMKTSPKGKFRVDEATDDTLEFYQEERTDNPILESNEEVFDWENVVIQSDEFDLVDDTTGTTPPVENNENPQEEGDEGYDTYQEFDLTQIEEDFGAATLDDYDEFDF